MSGKLRMFTGHLGPVPHELWEVLLVVVVESLHVFGVGAEPVHGGEVLPLGQLLVQAPEHLEEIRRSKRSRTNRVMVTCTIPRVALVTGSEKSPPGGLTAPTMLTLPSLSGLPRHLARPARS